MNAPHVFRFDEQNHEYLNLESGECYPHITGMLEQAGLVDDRWYTEESSDRGTAVHRLTADYDLKALDVATCTSRFRGYLLGHVKVVTIMQPTMLAVEEPLVHPELRFGGRPDRDCIVQGMRAVWEIKSGVPSKAHRIQTAMQAILIGAEAKLPPESIARFCCYLSDKGKYKLDEHRDANDFAQAMEIIRKATR